jgi:hypothetical protein
MHKLTAGLLAAAVICALAVPAGAMAAKPVKYVGKTDAGHKVTFRSSASTPWPNTWVLLNRTAKFELMRVPAFYWNEVTNHYQISNKKHRNGTITGTLRNVYEFLVPKYPIGTFSIYSCLGEATFQAKPAR